MNSNTSRQVLLRIAVTSLVVAALVITSASFAQQTKRQPRDGDNPTTRSQTKTAKTQPAELISVSEGELVISVDGRKQTQKLTTDTEIRLNGEPVRASELKSGDAVAFTTDPQSNELIVQATRIDVDPRESSPSEDDLEEDFKANPVFLGIMVAPAEEGVFVPEVALNGPADQAGIRAGDIILSVNGTRVASTTEFQEVLTRLEPGTKGKIVVLRDERKRELPIEFVSHKTAGFRPEESGLVEIEEPKACLGVVLIDPEPETEGLTIAHVHPDCGAAQAGLEPGDIIYSINQTVVKTPAAVSMMLAKMQPGEKITLLVRRDGERQTLTTELSNRTDLFNVSADQSEDTEFADEPAEHQLMVEQHRHFAKQNQRLEELSLQLLNEVKELRKEVQLLKNGNAGRN